MVYYNENDPFAAAWLSNLIAEGLIADGCVDDRSIADVEAIDLEGFDQCHFFAGIGGWSWALRFAGWDDERPVWTGSCPCQPFSAAGQQKGFADPRHLWPQWFRLIRQCRPDTVYGEQVASAMSWFDLVSGDLESEGYAVGSAIVGAHSVGAPHIRQRVYWVADTAESRRPGAREHECRSPFISSRPAEHEQLGESPEGRRGSRRAGKAVSGQESCSAAERSESNGGAVAVTDGGNSGTEREQRSGEQRQQPQDSYTGELEHASRNGRVKRGAIAGQRSVEPRCGDGDVGDSLDPRSQGRGLSRAARSGDGVGELSSRSSGHWDACDWLPCIDGKSRPVEPGTFPLAHGLPSRVGRLRGYGNAIVPATAQAFIEAYMDLMNQRP